MSDSKMSACGAWSPDPRCQSIGRPWHRKRVGWPEYCASCGSSRLPDDTVCSWCEEPWGTTWSPCTIEKSSTCIWCDGTGFRPHTGIMCNVCHGTGTVSRTELVREASERTLERFRSTLADPKMADDYEPPPRERDLVAEFDESFGQFRMEMNTPEIRDLMGMGSDFELIDYSGACHGCDDFIPGLDYSSAYQPPLVHSVGECKVCGYRGPGPHACWHPCDVVGLACENGPNMFGRLQWCDIPRTWWERTLARATNPCTERE